MPHVGGPQNYLKIYNAGILPVTWNADIANEDEYRRERDRGRIAEYVDEIIDLLRAMGMSDERCDVEDFISPEVEDEVNVTMTLKKPKCKSNSNIEPCSC